LSHEYVIKYELGICELNHTYFELVVPSGPFGQDNPMHPVTKMVPLRQVEELRRLLMYAPL